MIDDIRGPVAMEQEIDPATGQVATIGVFHLREVENTRESKRQGRTVMVVRPFIKISVPGQPHSTVIVRATEEFQRKYPKAWARFQEQGDEARSFDGTPIDHWPGATLSEVARLKIAGVYTVEAAAALTDTNCHRIGPNAHKMRERARQYIAGPGETERDLRSRIDELEKQVRALTGQRDTLAMAVAKHEARAVDDDEPRVEAPPPKANGRGRKRAAA